VGVASERDLILTLASKSSYSQPSYDNIQLATMPLEPDGRYEQCRIRRVFLATYSGLFKSLFSLPVTYLAISLSLSIRSN
jgi:hypothetical protein